MSARRTRIMGIQPRFDAVLVVEMFARQLNSFTFHLLQAYWAGDIFFFLDFLPWEVLHYFWIGWVLLCFLIGWHLEDFFKLSIASTSCHSLPQKTETLSEGNSLDYLRSDLDWVYYHRHSVPHYHPTWLDSAENLRNLSLRGCFLLHSLRLGGISTWILLLLFHEFGVAEGTVDFLKFFHWA